MARRTFSIVDTKVLEFIDGMESGIRSKYVVDLIKKDMGKSSVYVTRDEVIEMIKGIKIDKESSEDREVKNSLLGLLSGL